MVEDQPDYGERPARPRSLARCVVCGIQCGAMYCAECRPSIDPDSRRAVEGLGVAVLLGGALGGLVALLLWFAFANSAARYDDCTPIADYEPGDKVRCVTIPVQQK